MRQREMKLFQKAKLIRGKWDGTYIEKPKRCPNCNKGTQHSVGFLYRNSVKTGYAKDKVGWFCSLCGYHVFLYEPLKINELEAI